MYVTSGIRCLYKIMPAYSIVESQISQDTSYIQFI